MVAGWLMVWWLFCSLVVGGYCGCLWLVVVLWLFVVGGWFVACCWFLVGLWFVVGLLLVVGLGWFG